MSCHPTAEGTGVFKGVICALCLSVTVLSACLCVGFILPNRLTLVSGSVSWSLWAYRLASVINPRETRFRSLSFDLQESKEVGHVPFPGAIKRSLAGGRGNIIGPAKVRGG